MDMSQKTARYGLWGAGLLLGLAACGSAPEEPPAQDADLTAAEADLKVPFSESPSNGGEFNFCMAPAPDAPLNLTNAAWMSFFAANEYSNPGDFGAALTELGFHHPSKPDDDSWPQCMADLQQLKDFEAEYEDELYDIHIARDTMNAQAAEKMRALVAEHADHSEPGVSTEEGIEGFGPCARKWLQGSTGPYPNYQGFYYPAAAFEQYLHQTNAEGVNSHVQFFSGGHIREDGAKWMEGSTQVVVARHSTLPMAIVSFRGTQPDHIEDLLADGLAGKHDLTEFGFADGWGGGHYGFLSNVEKVAEVVNSDGSRRNVMLLRQLERWSADGITIWVTGHSLGAALGTLLTARMMDLNDAAGDPNRFRIGGLYTFGSPRVGDDVFAAKFIEATTAHGVPVARFRNDNDLVTSIPGSIGALNDVTTKFTHVGTLAFLNEDNIGSGTLRIGEWGEDPDYGVPSLADHDSAGFKDGAPIGGYYRQIKNQLDSGAHAAVDQCQ